MTNEVSIASKAILLIEDKPSVTAFLRAALERRGYTVTRAASGAEGLKHLEQTDFGGVISDIRMPGAVNGADVHDWISISRPALKPRMILITGDTANNETQALLAVAASPGLKSRAVSKIPFPLWRALSGNHE